MGQEVKERESEVLGCPKSWNISDCLGFQPMQDPLGRWTLYGGSIAQSSIPWVSQPRLTGGRTTYDIRLSCWGSLPGKARLGLRTLHGKAEWIPSWAVEGGTGKGVST